MDQKIKPTIVYGDVQVAEASEVHGLKIKLPEKRIKEIFKQSQEELKDLIECNPKDPEPTSD